MIISGWVIIFMLMLFMFYTCPQLFKDLLEAGTLACGMVRNNKKGFPAAPRQNLECNESAFLKSNLTEGYMTAVPKEKSLHCRQVMAMQ